MIKPLNPNSSEIVQQLLNDASQNITDSISTLTKQLQTVELSIKNPEKMFGNLVKAVVDIERGIMAVDAELHADEKGSLIEFGSEQENLWGINLYPEKIATADWIEFDSMINIRPLAGNRSPGVENPENRKKKYLLLLCW